MSEWIFYTSHSFEWFSENFNSVLKFKPQFDGMYKRHEILTNFPLSPRKKMRLFWIFIFPETEQNYSHSGKGRDFSSYLEERENSSFFNFPLFLGKEMKVLSLNQGNWQCFLFPQRMEMVSHSSEQGAKFRSSYS